MPVLICCLVFSKLALLDSFTFQKLFCGLNLKNFQFTYNSMHDFYTLSIRALFLHSVQPKYKAFVDLLGP